MAIGNVAFSPSAKAASCDSNPKSGVNGVIHSPSYTPASWVKPALNAAVDNSCSNGKRFMIGFMFVDDGTINVNASATNVTVPIHTGVYLAPNNSYNSSTVSHKINSITLNGSNISTSNLDATSINYGTVNERKSKGRINNKLILNRSKYVDGRNTLCLGFTQTSGGVSANGSLCLYVYVNFLPPVRTALLTKSASVSPGATVIAGTKVTFTNQVRSTGLSNAAGYNFTYNITGQGPYGPKSTAIPGSNPRNASSTYSKTYNTPGTYCRTIDVTAKPSWAKEAGDGKVCVTVTAPKSNATGSVSPKTYEKGTGGAVNIVGTLKCGTTVGAVKWNLINSAGLPNGPGKTTTCSSGKTDTITVDANSTNKLDGLAVGGYNYTVTITSPTAYSSPPASVVVYEVPYASFTGGDAYAGCGAGSNTGTSGKIIFNFNPNDTSKGASVEYAAIALYPYKAAPKVNNNIITAANRTGANPVRPNGLSALWAPGAVTCPNIGAVTPSSGTNPGADFNFDTKSGAYKSAGQLKITGGTVGTKVTVYSPGNILITGNIGIGAIPSPFNDANTPLGLIISNADIYIASNVTEINAVLVAKGTIYTCATGAAEATPRSDWENICKNKLTINGAISAAGIRFGRSTGTRLLGSGAAEQINYPAYLHFATPYQGPGQNKVGGYQSIFNAPPFL